MKFETLTDTNDMKHISSDNIMSVYEQLAILFSGTVMKSQADEIIQIIHHSISKFSMMLTEFHVELTPTLSCKIRTKKKMTIMQNTRTHIIIIIIILSSNMKHLQYQCHCIRTYFLKCECYHILHLHFIAQII
jgi:hypothetical protein